MLGVFEVELVVEYVVAGFQMAVHGLFSALRNPAAVGTWWVGLASMQRLLPSRDGWVLVSNMVVQGPMGVQQEAGAVKRQQGGFWTWLGAVLVCLGACSVVPELCAVDQSGAERGVEPLSTHTSLMTWQVAWTR
jgi:hypothetical protein